MSAASLCYAAAHYIVALYIQSNEEVIIGIAMALIKMFDLEAFPVEFAF